MSDPLDKIPARDWPIPPMDHEAGRKDTAFTWEMGHLILQRIADRETIAAITADPRMPAYRTVYQWMRVVPEFGEAVREVRDLLAKVRLQERDARRRPRRRSGRKSTYTYATARALCDRLEAGLPLNAAMAEPGMPSSKAVYRWLRDRPAFRRMYAEACEQRDNGLRYRVDLAMETLTPGTLSQAKAAVGRLDGAMGRLAPRTYRMRPLPG